jgi:hypothetical protein
MQHYPRSWLFAFYSIWQTLFTIFTSLAPFCRAEFSPDFRAFVHTRYGLPIVNQLERRDLGPDASTGGREAGAVASPKEPVVIVHGITNRITRFNVSNL